MSHVQRFIQDRCNPRLFWIGWFLVGHDPDPSSFAPFIAPAMKRDYNQIKFAFVVLDPAHAMDRRLVGQLDGLPSLRAI